MTSSPTTAVAPMTTPIPWSMKNRRPICAPGWISTPVTDRTSVDRARATGRPPGRCQIRCSPRYAQIACNPGEFTATSTRVSAAGSRSIAASRSSRTLAWAARIQLMSVDETLEQDRGQVALTEARDDDDDRLARVLRARRDLVRGG